MHAYECPTDGGTDGRLWRPGDGVGAFIRTLDISVGPQGRIISDFRTDVAERIRSFILASPHRGMLMPGEDDGKPQPMRDFRMGLSHHRNVTFQREDYPVDPTGLNGNGNMFCKGPEEDMLYINPVFMYQDILDLTDDPDAALSSMGFRRALRLSTLSRYRIGGMRNLKVTRRRLFHLAVEYTGKGDLDWMLDIVASSAYAEEGHRIPGLPTILRMYDGFPVGFIMGSIGVTVG